MSRLRCLGFPGLILLVVVSTIVLEPMLSLELKTLIYSLSLLVKDLIVFLMPLIVFGLLFASVVQLKGAIKLVAILLPLICFSNFISSWVGYLFGNVLVNNLDLQLRYSAVDTSIVPIFSLGLKPLVQTKIAMLSAILLAMLSQAFTPKLGCNIAYYAKLATAFLLKKVIIPLIPALICGFILKMKHDGILYALMKSYALIFLSIGMLQFSYIFLMYLIGSGFSLSGALCNMSRMLPAALTGLSTMSSAAALPLSLEASKQNVHSKDIVDFAMPITVNFHLLGDCIAVPIFALAVMTSFGAQTPDLISYLILSLYFVLAKFSVVAIPGGGIIVMWPILQSVLGFNAEMLSLIQALYILFDSILTSMNVLGNGAFVTIYDRIYQRLR